MSATPPFEVRTGRKFARDRESLRKKHYRKLPDQYRELDQHVEQVLDALQFDPYLNGYGEPEAFPNRQALPGWQLIKHRFPMPGLRGNASLGRIIYFFNEEEGVVLVSQLYTHAEYPKRPPAKELMAAFKALLDSANDAKDED